MTNSIPDENIKIEKNPNKKYFLIILITVLVIGATIAGYKYYEKHSLDKILDQAKAYEGIGDYDNAIEIYKKYLLQKRDDSRTKVAMAKALLKANQAEEAIRLLYLLYNETESPNIINVESALILNNTLIGEAAKCRIQAKEALEENQYKLARECYEKEFNFIEKRLLLRQSQGLLEEPNIDNDYDDYYALFENLANIAFSYVLEGKIDIANEKINDTNLLIYTLGITDIATRRYSFFYYKLGDLGSKYFEKKDYKNARKIYELSLESIQKCGSSKYKDIICELQYNIAITYYNESNYLKSEILLTKLHKDSPEYATKDVNKLIQTCRQGYKIKLAQDTYNKGHKSFEKEDYSSARDYYLDAMKYFKQAGLEAGSDILAELKYNIAMTYWNQKNFTRAKDSLLELRQRHPTYKKEDVQDYINKIVIWGY